MKVNLQQAHILTLSLLNLVLECASISSSTTSTTEFVDQSSLPDCYGEDCFAGNEAPDTPCSSTYCVCGEDFTYVVEECPAGLVYVFDPIESSCLDPEEVDACSEFGQGYCPEAPCEPEGSTEPYDQYECTASYCICNEVWEEATCSGSEVYNSELGECDDSGTTLGCYTTTTTTTSTTTTTATYITSTSTTITTTSTITTTTTTSTTTSTLPTTSTTFLCASIPSSQCSADGQVIEYATCSSTYCECADDGTLIDKNCDVGMVYDDQLGECVYPSLNSDCTDPNEACPANAEGQCPNPGQVVASLWDDGCSAVFCVCQDDGGYFVQICPPGLLYNESVGYCDLTCE